MNQRRRIAVVVIVLLVMASCSRSHPRRDDEPGAADTAPAAVFDAYRGALPAPPRQWAGPGPGVPTNQWWSSALSGPGTQIMWPQPLAARVSPQGVLELSQQDTVVATDGSATTPFLPSVTIQSPGATALTVVAAGALHVTLRVAGPDGEAFRVTLAQGSPVAELTVSRPVLVTGAEWGVPRVSGAHGLTATSRGRSWALATDGAADWQISGSTARLEPPGPVRVAVSPVPRDARVDWAALTAAVAGDPLLDTREQLAITPEGDVTQTLDYHRARATPAPVALQPHQRARLTTTEPEVGTYSSVAGTLGVRLLGRAAFAFAAVPVVWNAVLPSGVSPAVGPPVDTGAGDSSYFGGKQAWADALDADLAFARGDTDRARAQLAKARLRLDPVVHTAANRVGYDATWGTLIITPAEFGSDNELNDHILQYGYWVAAASIVAEHDPEWGRSSRAKVDALIADYAGTNALTSSAGLPALPARRTWSPYDGHSLASGVAPFGDGNNLESSSEAMHGWWAAARWFTVTDRAADAATFLARLSIESAVSRTQWLPDEPTPAGARPWSGVVWSAKRDLHTFFDPRPEAALGIKLLPLGPGSLARYPDAAAVNAARTRWQWCDRAGGGCGGLWPNLLDTDAVVAGHRPPTGPGEPEASTSATVVAWWRSVWTATPRPAGWHCTPGVTARIDTAGKTVVMASNPTSRSVRAVCRDDAGRVVWSAELAPGVRRWDA